MRWTPPTGGELWGQKIGGAIGGGVITYTANGAQKVAVATGFTSILWPTEVVTGKIVILGLGERLREPMTRDFDRRKRFRSASL